jgi:hypothetical protein
MKHKIIIGLVILAYGAGLVPSYQAVMFGSQCVTNPDNTTWAAPVIALTWPFWSVVIGTVTVLGGDPGIFACGSKYSEIKHPR